MTLESSHSLDRKFLAFSYYDRSKYELVLELKKGWRGLIERDWDGLGFEWDFWEKIKIPHPGLEPGSAG